MSTDPPPRSVAEPGPRGRIHPVLAALAVVATTVGGLLRTQTIAAMETEATTPVDPCPTPSTCPRPMRSCLGPSR